MDVSELTDTFKTLNILSVEIQNLTEHLKLQTDNYTATVHSYNDMVEVLIKTQQKRILVLELENSKLKRALASSDDELPGVHT